MSAELALGDLIEVRFFCQAEQQVSVNVRHFLVSTIVGAGSDIDEAAANFSLLMQSEYQTVLGATALYRGCGLRRLTPSPTLEVFSAAGSIGGTGGGDIMPGQVSGLIKLVSDTPGPSGRGRIYVPFPSEALNDVTGKPTALYLGFLQTFANPLSGPQAVDDGVGNGLIVAGQIINRKTLVAKVITADIIRDTWATQRRRRIGVAGDVPPI